jgi:hypothetical protein
MMKNYRFRTIAMITASSALIHSDALASGTKLMAPLHQNVVATDLIQFDDIPPTPIGHPR